MPYWTYWQGSDHSDCPKNFVWNFFTVTVPYYLVTQHISSCTAFHSNSPIEILPNMWLRVDRIFVQLSACCAYCSVHKSCQPWVTHSEISLYIQESFHFQTSVIFSSISPIQFEWEFKSTEYALCIAELGLIREFSNSVLFYFHVQIFKLFLEKIFSKYS